MTKKKKKEKKNIHDKYSEMLTARGADPLCHRCKHPDHIILDGYSFFPISETKNDKEADQAVPAILVVCANCGAVTPHALGAFEKLNKEKNATK